MLLVNEREQPFDTRLRPHSRPRPAEHASYVGVKSPPTSAPASSRGRGRSPRGGVLGSLPPGGDLHEPGAPRLSPRRGGAVRRVPVRLRSADLSRELSNATLPRRPRRLQPHGRLHRQRGAARAPARTPTPPGTRPASAPTWWRLLRPAAGGDGAVGQRYGVPADRQYTDLPPDDRGREARDPQRRHPTRAPLQRSSSSPPPTGSAPSTPRRRSPPHGRCRRHG